MARMPLVLGDLVEGRPVLPKLSHLVGARPGRHDFVQWCLALDTLQLVPYENVIDQENRRDLVKSIIADTHTGRKVRAGPAPVSVPEEAERPAEPLRRAQDGVALALLREPEREPVSLVHLAGGRGRGHHDRRGAVADRARDIFQRGAVRAVEVGGQLGRVPLPNLIIGEMG